MSFLQPGKALAASPDWVPDGNYNRTRDVKWRDVDLVVWIDRGFIRTLWQAVTRASRRARTNRSSGPARGTAKAFVGRSLARTLLSSGRSKPRSNRKRYQADMQNPQYKHIRFLRITRRQDAERLIASLKSRR